MVTHCDNLLHRKQACSQPGHYGRGAGQWGTGRPGRAAARVTGERTERGQVRRPQSSWHLGSSQCREGTRKEGAHSEDLVRRPEIQALRNPQSCSLFVYFQLHKQIVNPFSLENEKTVGWREGSLEEGPEQNSQAAAGRRQAGDGLRNKPPDWSSRPSLLWPREVLSSQHTTDTFLETTGDHKGTSSPVQAIEYCATKAEGRGGAGVEDGTGPALILQLNVCDHQNSLIPLKY